MVGDLPELVPVARCIPERLRAQSDGLLEHFKRGQILRDQDCGNVQLFTSVMCLPGAIGGLPALTVGYAPFRREKGIPFSLQGTFLQLKPLRVRKEVAPAIHFEGGVTESC